MTKLKTLKLNVIDNFLICPECGSENTHQREVDIYNRNQEDSSFGMHASVFPFLVSTTVSVSGNPSPRRQGMRIRIVCESCEKKLDLVIFQHKGQTNIGWEKG